MSCTVCGGLRSNGDGVRTWLELQMSISMLREDCIYIIHRCMSSALCLAHPISDDASCHPNYQYPDGMVVVMLQPGELYLQRESSGSTSQRLQVWRDSFSPLLDHHATLSRVSNGMLGIFSGSREPCVAARGLPFMYTVQSRANTAHRYYRQPQTLGFLGARWSTIFYFECEMNITACQFHNGLSRRLAAAAMVQKPRAPVRIVSGPSIGVQRHANI